MENEGFEAPEVQFNRLILESQTRDDQSLYDEFFSCASRLAAKAILTRDIAPLELAARAALLCIKDKNLVLPTLCLMDRTAKTADYSSPPFSREFQDYVNTLWVDVYQQAARGHLADSMLCARNILFDAEIYRAAGPFATAIASRFILPNLRALDEVSLSLGIDVRKVLEGVGYELVTRGGEISLWREMPEREIPDAPEEPAGPKSYGPGLGKGPGFGI